MSKLIECINNNSRTSDGTLISGHVFEGVCAIIDEDMERSYFVDKCENCGKIEVCFMGTDQANRELMQYKIVRNVGGPS